MAAAAAAAAADSSSGSSILGLTKHDRRELAKLMAQPTDEEKWLAAQPGGVARAIAALDVADGARFTRVSPQVLAPGALPAGVTYVPRFLSRADANALVAFSADGKRAHWTLKEKEGRETLLYGDDGVTYSYALNVESVPDPWPPLFAALKQRVEAYVKPVRPYNVCLGNKYANGREQFRFHADREERGNAVPIAVITVGAPRVFQFRRSAVRSKAIESALVLEHGSLLVMNSAVHDTHVHGLPPDRRVPGARYSFTFRSRLITPQPAAAAPGAAAPAAPAVAAAAAGAGAGAGIKAAAK